MITLMTLSFRISTFLTVPTLIPEKRTLFPAINPCTLLKLALMVVVLPNKFLFLPIRYNEVTIKKRPMSTKSPNFTLSIAFRFIQLYINQKILLPDYQMNA